MFSITIAFGNTSGWRFMFKTKEAADKAWTLSGSIMSDSNTVEIADDYGQIAEIAYKNITGRMFEDMTESSQAFVELQKIAYKNQAAVQKAIENDPGLRIARSAPMLSPMQHFNGR